MLITKDVYGGHVCSMTEARAKSRSNWVWGKGSGSGVQTCPKLRGCLLRGTGHQRERATLFRAAAWASGVPLVTAPMSQPTLWNTSNAPWGPAKRQKRAKTPVSEAVICLLSCSRCFMRAIGQGETASKQVSPRTPSGNPPSLSLQAVQSLLSSKLQHI